MAIFNSYFDITRGYALLTKTWFGQLRDVIWPIPKTHHSGERIELLTAQHWGSLGLMLDIININILIHSIYCICWWSSEVDRIWTCQYKSPLKWEHLNKLFYLLQDNYIIYILKIPWSRSIRGSRTFLEGIWIHREVCNYMLKYKIIITHFGMSQNRVMCLKQS
jgi:hypothetical protein